MGRRVYPRACGATAIELTPFCQAEGLSPRMRGNRLRQSDRLIMQGSIPAHAGQPSSKSSVANLFRVYPRACGAT